MNLVKWRPRKRWNDRDFWAPTFPMAEDFFENFFGRDWPLGEGNIFTPSLDLTESEDAYHVQVDLPGIDPKEIDLSFEDGVLTLSGERKSEHEDKKEGYYRLERSYGQFSRSLRLPNNVDADKVAADYKDGVLKITVPKAERSKAKRISIKAGK